MINTANTYSHGTSEIVLGKALKAIGAPRESYIVMTKFYAPVAPNQEMSLQQILSYENPDLYGLVNQYGASRKHIFDAVKASLKRLDLEYVDVLQCHRFSPDVEIPEVMHALHDIVKAGYARYIGMSSCWAWQFHAMQSESPCSASIGVLTTRSDYAITNNLTPFISMQNHYSLLYREEEREMNPLCKVSVNGSQPQILVLQPRQHLGVGLIPWSPLGRGLLCRPLHATSKRGEALALADSTTEADKTIINRSAFLSFAAGRIDR